MDFNHFLESVNQNISEALYRSNERGLIYANRAYAEIFGFDSEEEAMMDTTARLYKYPEQRDQLIKKLSEDGKFNNAEVTFVKRDGTEFIGLVSAVQFKSKTGEVFWDGSIRDITIYREIINKLLDREQLLDSINKNINEAIYRSKFEGGLIYINEEFVKMFGYDSVGTLLQGDVHDLYKNPADRDKIGEELVQGESLTNREVEFKRKDGSTFWGYLNSIKVKGQDGEIYFDGAIRDITKEKEADELAKQQAQMQELLIYISSGLINLPLEEIDEAVELSLQGLGEFVDADRAYIFEFKDSHTSMEVFSWVNEGISAIKNESEAKDFVEEVKQHFHILNQGRFFLLTDVDKLEESPLKKVYQKQKIKSLLNVPLLENGKCTGCVGFDWVVKHRDVSDVEVLLLKLFSEMYVNIRERSSRETELRKLFDKTIEQNQRLKDFSYITSHNFRSSVANLMGLLTILEEDRGNDEFFSMMKETALKLNLAIDSINDLLNFEKDLNELEKKDCDLNQIVSDIIVLNKKTSHDKNINFEVNIPDKLSVKVLPAYLQSVLLNLITNAMKYGVTPEKRCIYIEAKKERELVLLTIRDEGVGIDMERYGEKLFRLGSRFHADMDSGHGMGLYITKQQVEAIGGKIEVESEVNKGTTFKVYLNA